MSLLHDGHSITECWDRKCQLPLDEVRTPVEEIVVFDGSIQKNSASIKHQLAELASEYNNDQDIDHSEPHEPTDYERAIAHVQGYEIPEDVYCPHGELKTGCPECEFESRGRGMGQPMEVFFANQTDRPCNCEDYPCCGH